MSGSVVEMKKFRSPLKQIGGQIARLIVNPARGEVERDFFPRRTYFDGAKPAQDLLHLVHAALGKQQNEIIVAEPRGNV